MKSASDLRISDAIKIVHKDAAQTKNPQKGPASLQPDSPVNTPPLSTTAEEDFDVIEVVKHIDTIEIEDDDEKDCKVEETATISSNVLSRSEKDQPAFLNSRSSPGSPGETFLRIHNTNTINTSSTPSSDIEEMNSLKEDLLTSRLKLKEPAPAQSTDGEPSASYFDLTSNFKPQSTIKQLRGFSSSSPISNQNSFCCRSSEEDPFEGPSALLDDDSRSTLVLSSHDLTEDTLSADGTFSTLPTLPTGEKRKILSSSEKSIFDCPETYQFYYQNSSPEIRHFLDEICMRKQKITKTLDKYSNDDVTKPKTDRLNTTLNVKNSETAKINRQSSKVTVGIEKPDKTNFDNLKQKQRCIIKQKTGTIINEESIAKTKNNLKRCRTEIRMTKKLDQEKSQKRLNKNYEVESTVDKSDYFRYRHLKNTSNIDNVTDVNPEMLNQSNVTITPKHTSLISKEKKSVTFDPEIKVRETDSENNSFNDIQLNENKYKRKLSSNKINTNDNFPTSKKHKSDYYTIDDFKTSF